MKIGAVVPVYNRENFIGPYLDMLLDFGIKPVVVLSDGPWLNATDESTVPDRTSDILNKFYSDIQVCRGTFPNHKSSVNVAIRNLQDQDLILVNDCDMYITKEDWTKFIDFVNSNWRHDVFSINFEKMIMEYYYDWRYGKEALRGGDYPIVAMRPGIEFVHMTRASSDNEVVWNVDGPKFHHMRFCKKGRQDNRCVEPVEKTLPSAPKEVADRLIKWQEILKTL